MQKAMIMNLTLFLTILIALIIILSIILYNGLKIILTVEKKRDKTKYLLKLSILKIPVFKRESTDENAGAKEDVDNEEEDDDEDEESKSKKGIVKKYKEIKPILMKLIDSKEELKGFLKNILKTIDIKRIEGNLTIGLSNPTTTLKVACWIWSMGAVVNSTEATSLTVDPRYTEEIIDFEGKLELKINLLLLLIYSLILLTKKKIRELIMEIYRYNKISDDEEEEVEQIMQETEQKTETRIKEESPSN